MIEDCKNAHTQAKGDKQKNTGTNSWLTLLCPFFLWSRETDGWWDKQTNRQTDEKVCSDTDSADRMIFQGLWAASVCVAYIWLTAVTMTAEGVTIAVLSLPRWPQLLTQISRWGEPKRGEKPGGEMDAVSEVRLSWWDKCQSQSEPEVKVKSAEIQQLVLLLT